jgi:hypothetical protein
VAASRIAPVEGGYVVALALTTGVVDATLTSTNSGLPSYSQAGCGFDFRTLFMRGKIAAPATGTREKSAPKQSVWSYVDYWRFALVLLIIEARISR